MNIGRRYHFSASHYLPRMPVGHKCRRLHGHNYTVEVMVEGEINDHTGMVMDFADIDKVMEPLIKELDHNHLNDILGSTPTAEAIALWLWSQTYGIDATVRVWETENCWAEYP